MKIKSLLVLLTLTFFLSNCKKPSGDLLLDSEPLSNTQQRLDANFISLDDALKLATKSKSPGKVAANKSANGQGKVMSAPTFEAKTTQKKVKNYFVYTETVDNATLKEANKAYTASSEPLVYIVNYEGGGASIISSDKRFGDVIATFDNDITFTSNMEAPAPFVDFVEHAANSIKKIKENKMPIGNQNLAYTTKPINTSKSNTTTNYVPTCGEEFYFPFGTLDWTCFAGLDYYYVNVGPLASTEWGQGTGYNEQVPLVCNGVHAPTGCVATAMAQALKTYKYPTSYNWAAMPDLSGSTETARLMKDLGDMVDMNWGCLESGAYMSNANTAFNNMGINSIYVDYESTSSNPNLDIYDYWIRSRLTQSPVDGINPERYSSPVMVGGCRTLGQSGWWIFKKKYYGNCHAWLIDGRRIHKWADATPMQDPEIKYRVNTNETFHFNFGWDGYFNGWYKINFADANGYIHPSINYLWGQDIIVDIKKY